MRDRQTVCIGERMRGLLSGSSVTALVAALVLMLVFGAALAGSRSTSCLSAAPVAGAAQTTSDAKTMQILNDGIAKAWQLTSEGYSLMGGRPSLASDKPIIRDQIPAAKQKFVESEKVLDQAEPTAKYPHDQFPKIYTHADYVRASNLYGLGMIKLLEGDTSGAERHVFRSVDLAEDAFKTSLELMNKPAWADNARNCASLLAELHGLSAFIAGAKGNKDSQAEHERRLKELVDWMKANPR